MPNVLDKLRLIRLDEDEDELVPSITSDWSAYLDMSCIILMCL